MENNIEIMAPVGSYESLTTAIKSGAGSVYFGIEKLNMRSRSSSNFTTEDLKQISKICNENNVNSYITLNTIIFDDDIELMKKIVDSAKKNNISAIIASDISVMEYAKSKKVEVHISTQCNVTNYETVKFYSQYADVVVLARELSLKQISYISNKIKEENLKGPSGKLVKIELFAHGALCMAISGKCYLSLHTQNFSANRGACLQPCRRSYLIYDKEEKVELEMDDGYLLSPKDLCTISYLDKILKSGVSVLKIEGRGRSPEYVKAVVETYKEAINAIYNKTYNKENVEKWEEKLKSVFNRNFWTGYYLGENIDEWATRSYGNKATKTKVYVAKCTNYFSNLNVAEFLPEAGGINIGDEVLIIGPTTGVVEYKITEMRVDDKKVKKTTKGEPFSIKINETLRRSDKLYKVVYNIED